MSIGTIYFARCGAANAIKIGHTTVGAEARLRQLDTTGTPGPLELIFELAGSQQDERSIHELFADDRIRNNREWFRESSNILAFINERRAERDEHARALVEGFALFVDGCGWKLKPHALAQPCLHDVSRASGDAGRALVDAYRLHLRLMEMAWDRATEHAFEGMMRCFDELGGDE
jgi:hypothetical protein